MVRISRPIDFRELPLQPRPAVDIPALRSPRLPLQPIPEHGTGTGIKPGDRIRVGIAQGKTEDGKTVFVPVDGIVLP